ncbi:MAG: Threonine synthase [Candidatus Bathyarchaeota archaeon BA1]|nr:MAG: Threonine synthase [Candidatus Bathyarchaeota archaeon BA1]
MGEVQAFHCVPCGRRYDAKTLYAPCEDCGYNIEKGITMYKGLLEPVYDYEKMKEALSKRKLESHRGLASFIDFLPISERFLVSLGEGDTPLLHCKDLSKGLRAVHVKFEGSNPTSCFKDRESSMVVSKALELGFKTVACASSGNAAASLAAYSAKAGLKCRLFVPRAASPAKITQMAVYGAEIVLFDGIYEEAFQLSNRIISESGEIYNCNSAVNPLRSEGDKTTAMEICRDLSWSVPDDVFVPVGNGSNLYGIWRGFKELYETGIINTLPRMIGVGVDAGAPLVEAYKRGFKEAHVVDCKESVAEGAVSAWSYDAPKAIKAIKDSNGAMVSVSDDEVIKALKSLAKKEGVFAGPSGIVGLAGMLQLIKEGKIDKYERAVAVLTEGGLKDMRPIANLWKDHVVQVTSPIIQNYPTARERIGDDSINKVRRDIA